MAIRARTLFALVLLALPSLSGLATAQDYPTREIRSVVNFPPGTGIG
jgi:tripartite-type tricarboxylate transporter receptor subunit TctC